MHAAQLPPFALEAYFARWEFRARYHLTASDGETCTVAELLDLDGPGAREEFLRLPLGYRPTWGTDALREAVAATYTSAERDDVLAFAGAEEGIFWTLQELLGPGDHAVVTVPNYQAAESVPLATGAAVSPVRLWEGRADGDLRWRLDVDAVRRALRPTTRVVVVNAPNNPTGLVPDRDTWLALARLCDERGLHLFSDEVYRGLELDPARRLPAAVDVCERGISLDVTSKSLGLPGLRVGWVATHDRALLARLEARKHWTSICNAAPSEHLATVAVRHAEELRARIREVVRENLPQFAAFFAEYPDLFTWEPPDGGCVAFPRYRGPDGVERFCADLVEERGVLLLPASVYASALTGAGPAGDGGPGVPADRFRVGVGRRGPGAALDALRGFVEDRHSRLRMSGTAAG
jgi:aspartate/methionine/tyrosine aminotransferase